MSNITAAAFQAVAARGAEEAPGLIPPPYPIAGWIGVLGGALGVISFMRNLIEEIHKKYFVGSYYKVGVGASGMDREHWFAGKGPQVEVYDADGKWVGHSTFPHDVKDGETATFDVAHERQGAFSIFNGHLASTCVSFVATKWNDRVVANDMKFLVIGEFGKYCGAHWYESLFQPYPSSPRTTACMWIGPRDKGHHTGFQVHWPAFAGDEASPLATRIRNNETISPTEMCDGIKFGMRMEYHPSVLVYNNTNTGRIEYRSPGKPKPPGTCIEWRDYRSQRDRDLDPNFIEQCFSKDKVSGRLYAESSIPGWARLWDPQKCSVPDVGFCPIFTRPISGGVVDAQKPSYEEKPKEPKEPKEPSLVRRDDWMTQQLTLSNHESHSARRLCESDMSHGPDFAHDEERLFCEMGSKTLYPFCGGPDGDGPTTDCFDAETRTLVDTGRRYKRDAAPVAGYLEVRDWRTSKARYD